MKTSFTMILKNGWVYGLILAAIAIVFSLLTYIFNVNMFSVSFGIISFLIFVIAIPVTIGILGGNNYSYIFNNFIDPDYMKLQIAKMTEMLQNYNVPQDQIDKSIAKAEAGNQIGKQLLNSLIISAVLSLLVALVIRKKDKVEEKMV